MSKDGKEWKDIYENELYENFRIKALTKKGYVICGDNRVNLERDITDKDIVGVLTAFYHNGKSADCKAI